MASPRSPSASPRALPQHGVDLNGYLPSLTGGEGDASFESNHQSRQRRGSSPGKRALNWFTRSRSNSPNLAEPSSPTSFVVRNVTKQPGGVSQGQYGGALYQQIQSQPLTTSLGVPPGGPGGGVGYGTAKSSNDGRPELNDRLEKIQRGRSRSPTRPPSPGAITAGAFRSGRVSPGPMSWTQARTAEEVVKRPSCRDQHSSSPHQTNQQFPSSPTGPRSISHLQQQQQQQQLFGGRSPQSSSPLAGSVVAPSLSTISVNANDHNSRFSMPVRLAAGSGPPPIIPLEGVPSPIDIPSSPAQAGITPFGSVSPGGSPGQFHRDHPFKASPGSPGVVASRWMKGLFGKSPRLEETRDDTMYSNHAPEQHWAKKGTSPSAPYSSKLLHNAWSDGSPLGGADKADEMEAQERKRQSMHMAARIEDHHRDLISRTQSSKVKKEWSPRQTVVADSNQAWSPQSKSPSGRKPVPRYSVQELQEMTQKEREMVADQVDPHDRLSKLEGRLTPAQQIIADTRSKQLVKDQGGQGLETQVQRGFNSFFQAGETESPPVPAKSRHASIKRQEVDVDTPVRRGSKKGAAVNGASTPQRPRQSNAGLSAGHGPLPIEMPIGEALQEMMIRFYRFERYAVPLMRSLEARIVDVERDNQMALYNDSMSANSARDREMDKWVGQMTGLMKHEIGQLKAATREIREGRETLALCVKGQNGTSSGFLPSRIIQMTDSRQESPIVKSSPKKNIDVEERNDTVTEMKGKGKEVDHSRKNSFSSYTFKSAIPVPSKQLALDISKSTTSPTPETLQPVQNVNSSPNGRTRYTSVLGQPMNAGKISPAPSPRKGSEIMSLSSSPTPSNQSSARRAQSLNDRLQALVVDKRSPSIASVSTQASSPRSGRDDDEVEGEESDNTSFEKLPSQIVDKDYQVVMARGNSKAPARTASGGSDESVEVVQHLQKPSSASNKNRAESTTVKKSQHDKSRSNSSNGAVETSFVQFPSPGLSRQRSISPAALCTTANITTASHASNNLRARAQSYLLNADSHSNSSTPSSPSPSPRLPLETSPVQVKPLRVQKSATTIQTKSPDLLGFNAPTIKSNNSTNNVTPVRPSIRDRVAFFDAAKS